MILYLSNKLHNWCYPRDYVCQNLNVYIDHWLYQLILWREYSHCFWAVHEKEDYGQEFGWMGWKGRGSEAGGGGTEEPCKSSSRTALNHTTLKGPREPPETCDYPPRCRGNRGNNLKILNRCVLIPLPINQVTWQPFSSLALGRRGRHIPLWEGGC